ncbi:TIGR04076 family protein [Bacteroidota bacterium]
MKKEDRRKFCKNTSCMALGTMASSSLFPGLLKDLTIKKEFSLENKNIMPNKITVKVISQKGTCGLGHKVGDEIIITENGIEGKICIHALYSFLPKTFAMMFDAKFPWLEDPDVSTSACPDAHNPVVFELSRKKGE